MIEKRVVSYEEASEYAKEKNLNYVELSAKTGKNVAMAFQTIVEEIYKLQNGVAENTMLTRDPSKSTLNKKSNKK